MCLKSSDPFPKLKAALRGWVWCLMPIILATWEAEIGRIVVGGQPGQKFKRPIRKLGMVVWACVFR
jgi:hypothetical protein